MFKRLFYIISLVTIAGLSPGVVVAMQDTTHRDITLVEKVTAITEQELKLAVAKLLETWHSKGYMEASIDSIAREDSVAYVYLSRGREFFYIITEKFNIEKEIPGDIPDIPVSQQLSFSTYNTLIDNLLTWFGNNGYPFARVNQENVNITANTINLKLRIVPGELILFDTIHISGNARLSRNFMMRLMGISEGMVYQDKLVRESAEKLSDLDYVRLTAPLQLRFSPGRALLVLPVQKNNSNQFDAIAGLSGGDGEGKPVRLNGSLMLYLSNFLGNGESLSMSWKGPGGGTQILDIKGNYPYPFNLPLESELIFSLHRQDTSWIQFQIKPLLLFSLAPGSKMGVFWDFTDNNLISAIPARADQSYAYKEYSLNTYGLEFRYATPSFYRQLIKSGIYSSVTMAAGRRKFTEFSETMDSDIVSKSHFSLSSHIEIRRRTGGRATLSVEGFSAFQSGNNLPVNQLFKLGGFRILKGFDELSIYASSYALTNIEFRVFTGAASYINLFANGGWYEHKGVTGYFNRWPAGIGSGLNLQTPAGIFSINVAMGWQEDQQAEIRNAKVHIGYITRF